MFTYSLVSIVFPASYFDIFPSRYRTRPRFRYQASVSPPIRPLSSHFPILMVEFSLMVAFKIQLHFFDTRFINRHLASKNQLQKERFSSALMRLQYRPHTASKIPVKTKSVSRIKQLVCKIDEHLKKGQFLLVVCSKFEKPFDFPVKRISDFLHFSRSR